MEADIVITIALVAGVVLIINQLSRIVRASIAHKSVREAISRDSNVTPELLEKIDEQRPQSGGDDRNGLVLVALGAAIFCYGLIQGDADDIRNLAGIALFPLFVGASLLGRAWMLRRAGAAR